MHNEHTSHHSHEAQSHDHGPGRTVERTCDVAVVGGSAAGLAAALQLGRQDRSVIVIDAGEPRNAPAAHMHGYLGHEGLPPSDLVAIGRAEVRQFGVEVIDGRVVDAKRDDELIRLALTGGSTVVARRIVIATGLVDVLPEIEGLREHWGSDVIHCPFCHGYEVRDRKVAMVVTSPLGLHPAGLFRHLTDDLTLVLHGDVEADEPGIVRLADAGVRIIDGSVARLVDDSNGSLVAIELVDGTSLDVDAVAVSPRFRVRAEPFSSLDLKMTDDLGLGRAIETDQTGATSAYGVFAAGNVTNPSAQVLNAASDGALVGAFVAFSLATEDLDNEATSSGNREDWERRYEGDVMWSGRPNPALVDQVADLSPGTALDVGAGEGGDAVWLAEHGWAVTASDISQNALRRIAAVSSERGLPIDLLHADANAVDSFGGRAFDLVTAHYASIPRTADDRAVHNMIDAVAPGGTLLVVGHDLEPMRQPIDTTTASRPFDPDAYVRVDDVRAVLESNEEWSIVVDEIRERPQADDRPNHHIHDIVLRAMRGDG